MMRLADRRTILLAAGTAAIAAITGPVSAQPTEIAGTIGFEGGGIIPKGDIRIYVDDPSAPDDEIRRVAETRVSSDGSAKAVDFTLSPSTIATVSPGAQIVARLERPDGWLLARGRAQVVIGSRVHITLHTVMY